MKYMDDIKPPIRIDIWHNIMWSQYKGEVFSSIYALSEKNEFEFYFFQVADTEGNRIGLSDVDLSRHRYPFTRLFSGAYEATGLLRRMKAILSYTWRSNATMSVLSGYEKPEIWAQLLLLKLKRQKVAVFCDSTIYDQKQRFLRGLLKRIFFRLVDGVFGYGMRSKEYVIHYGADPRHVYYRCQAAALPKDYNEESALAQRLAHAPRTDAPRFLYVGRLSPEKSLYTLIDAFAQFAANTPGASLILIGNGPMKDELQRHVNTLGLDGSVRLAGSKSGAELFNEYSSASAFILPSTSEPWGLVVNEALSYGCPVIVSHRCGCIPELVINGVTGYVHEAQNVADLAEKMRRAVSQFENTEKTARDCMALMRRYTPDMAAKNIISGCRAIITNTDAMPIS